MVNFSKIRQIDIWLILPVTFLVGIGLLGLHSATLASIEGEPFFTKQVIWIILSIVVFLVAFLIDIQFVFKLSWLAYLVSILLLIAVKLFGVTGYGATRWIAIGPLHLQPSELAKISVLLVLSQFFYPHKKDPNKLTNFIKALILIAIPMGLTFFQPDLGTSLVFGVLFLPLLHWAGLNWIVLFCIVSPFFVALSSFHYLTFLIAMVVITGVLYLLKQKNILILSLFLLNIFVGLMTPLLWNSLKPYQQARIKVFISPEKDPRGAGYQIIQSKVAIGSGGVTGKGWHKGTQVRLGFLPEQHTDFIIAVLGEEFGFIGMCLIIIAFFLLFNRLLYYGSKIRERRYALFIIGVLIIWAFHVFVNIGMTIGLMPVTGLPLPFLSYGGTAMLINFLMLGLANNIWVSRYYK
ncbi:MAG: rod shape-determining protein RodA [Calditrichia bacterium]